MSPGNFDQTLERLVAKAGVPRLTSHGLRHTAATHMVRHAADIGEIRAAADLLGHSPDMLMKTYAHALPESVRTVTDHIAERAEPAGPNQGGQQTRQAGSSGSDLTLRHDPTFTRVIRGTTQSCRRPCAVASRAMELTTIIETRAGVRSGKPCFVGTRIAVYDVLDYLASGMTSVEIVRDFPELTDDHVKAAIEFAAMRERRLATPA